MVVVDPPLAQEFVPSSKRAFVGGLVTTTVSVGGALGALCGTYFGPIIGWRGLFLIGLLPAVLTLLIRAWVPESPRWLIRKGRREEAARSIAWALQIDPGEIELPAVLPEALMAHSFFGGGSYTIIAPYMAEVWPAGLRASGMGLGYGVGNCGKIISPLGLALIVGGSKFVKPAAAVGAMIPAMYFLAFWAALAAVAFVMLGIETKGRSIEEIDAALTGSAPGRQALGSLAARGGD